MDATAATPMRFDDAAALRDLAEALVGAADLRADAVTVEEAVDRALRRHGPPTGATWAPILDDLTRALQLSARWRVAPLADVAEELGPALPAVAWSPGGWTLLTREHARPRYRRFPGASTSAPVTPAMRAEGVAAWALVEPALPGSALSDPTHEATPLERLTSLLQAERRDLWVLLVYAFAVALLGLAVPVAVQVLVNTVAFGAFRQPLLALALGLLGALGLAAALRVLQRVVVEMIQRRLFVRMSVDLAARLPRARSDAFEHATGSELINRFFDVVNVQKSLGTLLLEGVGAVIQAAVGMILLAVYHPALLVYDVLLAGAIAAILWGGFQRAQRTAIIESKRKYQVAGWLEEIAARPTLYKLGGGVDLATGRADRLARSWLDARADHFRVYIAQYGAVLALQAVANTALLAVGGWLVIDQQLALGQLVAAELIVSAVLLSVAKFAEKLESAYDLLAAIDKLGHLVDLPLERSHGWAPTPKEGPIGLVVDRVDFAYAAGTPILEDASLSLAPGERALIVGDDGSGRSTVADLLIGMHEPQRGRILLDTLDLRELRLDALRRKVALVRDTEVVSGTVHENVCFGRVAVDPQQVQRLLERVGVAEAVAALPQGSTTKLLPTGAPLTDSDRVRLSVARAMAGRPRLIVVDGLLDKVDESTARTLMEALSDRSAPWTLVVLSRNPALARYVDRAWRLEDHTLRPMPRLTRGEP